jgi:fermentation-respiration switch protein FrsA (DUF1100 family)
MQNRKSFVPLLSKAGRSFCISIIIATVVSYIILSPPLMSLYATSMLFHPMPPDEELYQIDNIIGVKKQDIYFKSAAGNKLHGWFFEKPNSKKIILIAHGNGGNLAYRIDIIACLLKINCSVMIFDYQGYGLSAGIPSPTGICQDGDAAYNYLVNTKKIKPQNIIVYGESLGGAVACHIANTKPVGGIILQSTFSSLLSIARQKLSFLQIYPDWLGLDFEPRMNNVSALSHNHPPLLIIHGDKDRMIPISEAKMLFDKASPPKNLVVLVNTGHTGIFSDLAHFMPAITTFIDGLDSPANH